MQPTAFRFDPFLLDPATRELRRDGALVALPPRAFACLVMLVEQRDRALGRDELIAALWPRASASDVQLGQLILQCRRALDDDGQAQRTIRTVPGFGYRWVAPVEPAVPSDAGSGSTAHGDDPAPQASPMPAVAASAIVPGEAAVMLPASATESASAPVRTRTSRRDRRFASAALAGAALVVLMVAAVFGWRASSTHDASPSPAGAVVVLPLQAADGDGAWIRLGGMDLIGDRLRRSGMAVLPSDATVSLLRTHGGAAVGAPTPQALAALRDAAGARVFVSATLVQRGEHWQAEVVADAGDAAPRVGRHDDASPMVALREATDRLAAALGHVPPTPVEPAGVAETLQRARAAMLANEPEAARAILLADANLAKDAPRLRQQLAEVDIRAGRFAAARGELQALLAETPASATTFRAELLAALGTVEVRSADYAAASRVATEAIALDAGDDPILTGRLHLMRGVARISLQDYAGALVDNGVAREAFQRAGDPGSVARVDSNVGALEILRGHPAQAEPYLERAIARFRELGVVQEPIGNLQLLFVARRQQLHLDAAMAAIDEAWAQRDRMVNPDSRLSVRMYRVQALLRAGRLGEAAVLLDDPANDRTPSDPSEAERLPLLRAELSWRRGRPEQALAHLEGLPEDELASADNDVVRADVAVLRSRLERELGIVSTQPIPLPASDAGTPVAHPRMPWRLLASANRLATAGQAEDAERAYQLALTAADALGVAETLAAVVDDYTRFLLAAGRTADAAALAHRIALWSGGDYDGALVQLRLARAQGRREAWQVALDQARALAGERVIPAELAAVPAAEVRAGTP